MEQARRAGAVRILSSRADYANRYNPVTSAALIH